MKTLVLILLSAFLIGCGEYVDLDTIEDGDYVNCENVGESICAMYSDPVCAKIKIIGKVTDNVDWEQFSNPCKACASSTKERKVIGFEMGKCGLDRDERSSKSLLPSVGKTTCGSEPSDSLLEMCSQRNGRLVPEGSGCDMRYHCVISG